MCGYHESDQPVAVGTKFGSLGPSEDLRGPPKGPSGHPHNHKPIFRAKIIPQKNGAMEIGIGAKEPIKGPIDCHRATSRYSLVWWYEVVILMQQPAPGQARKLGR